MSTGNLNFQKPFLVYIPARNCRDTIIQTLDGIPADVWDKAEVLVVDNDSTDKTSELVLERRKEGHFPGQVHIVKTKENVGYAGSQKLAYSIAVQADNVQWVIMLHGDGQYPPHFLKNFIEAADQNSHVVYGVRSKKVFRKEEETPLITYFLIKALSLLESCCTGYWRLEWHSGYVMYKKYFLENVGLSSLTETMHIDGHMQFRAGRMGLNVKPLYIYKRYKDLTQFEGLSRIIYVFNVLKLMTQFRFEKTGPGKPERYNNYYIVD